MLTGACLSRALGLHRRIRHATLALVIAAELPDIDYVYAAGGPLTYFQHHRGWTHSLLWLPVMAVIAIGFVWLWHRWKVYRKAGDSALPLNWPALLGYSCIALLTHLLLDWTNNYGIRPFAPFNPRWYQGEIVFIFEPVIFALLLLALILAPIFRLTDKEVGATRTGNAAQRLAILALLGVLCVWGLRFYEHNKAMQLAQQQEMLNDASILRIGLNPMPINPFTWDAVIETPDFYQTGIIDTRTGTMTTTSQDIYWKGEVTPAVMAAKTSWLGRIYLDWSKFPLTEDLGISRDPDNEGLHIVRFRDLRFSYQALGFNGREHTPLSAYAYVDAQNHVVRIQMNNHTQRQ